MNINDLTHEQLNTLAALGQGWNIAGDTIGVPYQINDDGDVDFSLMPLTDYDPCNNGSQAMELVEKYELGLWRGHDMEKTDYHWCANNQKDVLSCDVVADTPTVAITKAFVASVYGVEVDFDSIVGGWK